MRLTRWSALGAIVGVAACGGSTSVKPLPPPSGPFESRAELPASEPTPEPSARESAGHEHTRISPPGTEREICHRLMGHSDARVEDTVSGVRLVLTPAPGVPLEQVAADAHRFETHLGAAAIAPADPQARCPLFTVGRMGAAADVVVASGMVIIHLRVNDPSNVQPARNEVRTFVSDQQAGMR